MVGAIKTNKNDNYFYTNNFYRAILGIKTKVYQEEGLTVMIMLLNKNAFF